MARLSQPKPDFPIRLDKDCATPMAGETHSEHPELDASQHQASVEDGSEHSDTDATPATHDDDALAAAYAAFEADELLPEGEIDEEKQEPATEETNIDKLDQELEVPAEEQTKQEPEEDAHEELHDDEPSRVDSESHADTEDVDDHDEDNLPERRPSFRTEALIKAAARVVIEEMGKIKKDDSGSAHDEEEEEEDENEGPDDSILSYTTHETDDQDDTIHPDSSEAPTSRGPSPTAEGDTAENSSHHASEDDVFSDHSPRSSTGSSDEDNNHDDEATEKLASSHQGSQSPYSVRSRVVSGTSTRASGISTLSHYDTESNFKPVSRNPRPVFHSPTAVVKMQMPSPTPSARQSTSPSRSSRGGDKRLSGVPTISRLGSPAQFSPKGRGTPPRFKQTQDAPLVLLHVTLLPLRWVYGDLLNNSDSLKIDATDESGKPTEGLKNIRGAWRQLQERLGDTVLERGILLPHPQNDYEVLEERVLEALELPLRRRARILECGHYLGPSNEMTLDDDDDDDYDDEDDEQSDDGNSSAFGAKKHEKRHWCSTCKGDIRYEELGADRVFRIKVYASNGLMKGGAWEACWKEMERVDIEVEPIVDTVVSQDLAKLATAYEEEQRRQIEEEQRQQIEEEKRLQSEDDQRILLEQEHRQQLEGERQQLELQRQQLEEDRRQHIEDQRLAVEKQRQQVEEEQRQNLEEERRQSLEEQHRELEEQRLQLEEQRLQLEEERRQRLEEEERRLQREEEEQKQISAPSRASFVEDELPPAESSAVDRVDMDGRRRDSDRMREIYGHSRASSDFNSANNAPNAPTPSIHIHLDSNGRQRPEEDNRLTRIPDVPTTRDSMNDSQTHIPRQDTYIPPPTPTSPSEQVYERRQGRRKSLQTASLPELVGETIRVLLHDPKNVAIIVLGVLIMMLAVRNAPQQLPQGAHHRDVMAESDAEILRSLRSNDHHHHQQQQQIREPVPPVGQVIMNTPVQYQAAPTPEKIVETVYKTVTESSTTAEIPSISQIIETVYATVTPPSKVVETIYKTVTAEAPEKATEPAVGSESSASVEDPCDKVVSRPSSPSLSPESKSENQRRVSDNENVKIEVEAAKSNKKKNIKEEKVEPVRIYETVTETVVVNAKETANAKPEIEMHEEKQIPVARGREAVKPRAKMNDEPGFVEKVNVGGLLELEEAVHDTVQKTVKVQKQPAGVCVYGNCEDAEQPVEA